MFPVQPVSTGTGMGWGVSANQAGGIFATGYFNKEAAFGEFQLSSENESGYVVKLTNGGEVEWANKLASSGSDYTLGYGASALTDGSVIISGTKNQKDALISKFDGNGNNLWQVTASNGGIAFDVVVLSDSSSVAVGYYSGTASFGSTTLTSAGNNDVFVAKISPTGQFLWAKSFGGVGNDSGWGIAKSSDDSVVITGSKEGVASFGSNSLDGGQYSEAFIAKLDSSGNVLWAKDFDSSAVTKSNDIAVLTDGSIAITGSVKASSGGSFTGIVGGSALSNANGIYLSKLDSDGTFLWTKNFSTASNPWGQAAGWGVATLPNGGIAVSGNYYATTSFGATNLEVSFPDSNNSPEVFVASLASDGSVNWAKSLNGKDHNYGYGLGTSVAGDIYLTGNSFGDAYLDSKKIFTASGAGSTPYVSKLSVNGEWSYPEIDINVSKESVGEGEPIVFDVTSNQGLGTKIYWMLSGSVSKEDFESKTYSGFVQVDANGTSKIEANLSADLTTEGVESLYLSLYNDPSFKQLITQSDPIQVYDSSKTPPTYSIANSSSEIAEGESIVFTVNTTDVDSGSTVFWKLVGKGISQQDLLEGSLSGSAAVNGNGQFEKKFYLANDQAKEGTENLNFELYKDSAFSQKLLTSAAVSIKDTSQSADGVTINIINYSENNWSTIDVGAFTSEIYTNISWNQVKIGDFNADSLKSLDWGLVKVGDLKTEELKKVNWSAVNTSTFSSETYSELNWSSVKIGDLNAESKKTLNWSKVKIGGENGVVEESLSTTDLMQVTLGTQASTVNFKKTDWNKVGFEEFSSDSYKGIEWSQMKMNKLTGSTYSTINWTEVQFGEFGKKQYKQTNWSQVDFGDFKAEDYSEVNWGQVAFKGAKSVNYSSLNWSQVDFSDFSAKTFKRLNWSQVKTSDLTAEQYSDINWSQVKFKGAKAPNLTDLDISQVVQADSFSKKNAKQINWAQLSADDLSSDALSKLQGFNVKKKGVNVADLLKPAIQSKELNFSGIEQPQGGGALTATPDPSGSAGDVLVAAVGQNLF